MRTLLNRNIEHLEPWTMSDVVMALAMFILTLILVLGG